MKPPGGVLPFNDNSGVLEAAGGKLRLPLALAALGPVISSGARGCQARATGMGPVTGGLHLS